NKVYALDGQTGEFQWEFKTRNQITCSPTIARDGTIYIGSFNKRMHALDGQTGKERWSFRSRAFISSSPAIAKDGTIYFGTWDKTFLALDGQTGKVKWKLQAPGYITSSSVLSRDGTIYIGAGSTVTAIAGTGHGPQASAWPMRGGNARHTGRATSSSPEAKAP
ncbi:MAG: PQQ-binding-like beta-propeller repeat protein, partial [Pirellulaceae bacterium]